jgi:hypothetical protein
MNPKVHFETQNPRIAKAILSKKSNTGIITIPSFKLYYRATAIKTASYWHKNRHKDQENRIEDPDMNLHSYAHLIFDKGTQNIQWRRDNISNKYYWKHWISTCRKLQLDPFLSPCTSISSKWIKDLNIRPETLKLVQERAENTMELLCKGKNLVNRAQMAQQLRQRIDKWDYMKLKSFSTTKEIIIRLKRQPTEWEKIFAKYALDKTLIARIYRKLKKLNFQKNQ